MNSKIEIAITVNLASKQAEQMKSRKARRLRASAFVALTMALIVDLIATFCGARDWPRWDQIGLSAEYGIYCAGALIAAIRLMAGKGIIVAACTLSLIFLEACLAIVIIFTAGRGSYHAPWYVYVTHTVMGMAYCGAWAALVSAVVEIWSRRPT